MKFHVLEPRPNHDTKFNDLYLQFQQLLSELEKKELPESLVSYINTEIVAINTTVAEGNSLTKIVKQKQTEILKRLSKETKIVPKNYYRNIWLPVGMTVFGLPIGFLFSRIVDNPGLFAIGLPIGMAFGVAVGLLADKKAAETGKQLDLEIKH